MGMSKAMMEKVMVAASRSLDSSKTVICGTRYGNVMASRGSVIPLFAEQILGDRPMTVTDFAMTRFMMSLDEAVELVMHAFEHGANGDIFVQKSPAATLKVLTSAMRDVFDRPNHPVVEIGTRHGEKLYESLLSREEFAAAEDVGAYYRIPPDGRDLNYEKYMELGEQRISRSGDYTSHNTRQLDVSETAALLHTLPFVQRVLNGRPAEEY
jgi:UDP-glucose 4-epimerase